MTTSDYQSPELGAQPFLTINGERGVRFGVYAPNARNVEVVFGLLWREDGQNREPVDRSNPVDYSTIAGGYIADDGDGIDLSKPVIPLLRRADGCWFSDPNHPELQRCEDWDHVSYMFRIVKNDGSTAYRTDLYSRCQIGGGHFNPEGAPYDGLAADLDGTRSCSVIVDPDTVVNEEIDPATQEFTNTVFPEPTTSFVDVEDFWTDEFSEDADKQIPTRIEDMIIYELHIPALGFGKDGVGTIADAVRHLDHLVELGVNAVELLPISEYSATPETWGYSTSHYHAIEFSGGGRDKMKYLIREAHRRGIAVIIDVVYNHYAHDAERAEWMYDTNDHEKNIYYWYEGHPYDYPGVPHGEHWFPGCDGYLDNGSSGSAPNYKNEFVKKLFLTSATALVREFHVDGFRVDLTSAIHKENRLHYNGSPCPAADGAGYLFLREWTEAVRNAKPGVFLMAEDHSNWPGVTEPVGEGGLGFDAVWYSDFHHHLCGANRLSSEYAKLITTAGFGDDRPLAMGWFAGALEATQYNKIVYHVNHDEAGNSGRDEPNPEQRSHRTMHLAVNGQMNAYRPFAEARSRVAFAVACFSAGTPLFLFGEEVAFENDFIYDNVLALREDFTVKKNGNGREMYEFYRDAIRLRREEPAFHGRNLEILGFNDANRILAFRRWYEQNEAIVVVSLSNSPFDRGYVFERLNIPNGSWQEVLNGDAEVYGGGNCVNREPVASFEGRMEFLVPKNAVLVLKKIS